MAWAVGNFSIFRHKGSYARRICQGTFHSPGKKSPVLASLVRYFLPFALDKYSVLRWQVFRKKEKNDGWFTEQRENVQDLLSAKGRNKIKFDDYMQYSPMVAVYGLNLAGVKGKHSFKGRTIILAMSYATMGMIVNTMKYSFKEKRPDSNTRNSFPSGHTATAFMGAEFLYREYRDVSPWIGYAGYAIAAITGYLRIYNDRHYLNDVVAGACIGVLSTKLAYWLYPKIFKKSECYKEHVAIVTLPYYSAKEVGLNMCICF